jgi:hypothetical protein
MGPISATAEAGIDILRKLASGELEVHGILLRDSNGKRFRYILRGFEDLRTNGEGPGDIPLLDSLQSALSNAQLLQIVSIAQNVAIAATLRRIEARLAAMEELLSDIQARMARIQTAQSLTLDSLRTQPVSRLKAAKTAAIVAMRHGDRTALIAAGKDAQQAFHDLLEQAKHLVRIEEDGVPVALRMPIELADLCESAADAAYIASSIWIALDSRQEAMTITNEAANALQSVRRKLGTVLTDPELLLRRMKLDEGLDDELQATGRRLQSAIQSLSGRAMMIEHGLVNADPKLASFEFIAPVRELSFVPIGETEMNSSN